MKVGFIGCGNMAKAMIHGMLGSKKVQPQEMIASAKSEKTREAISSQIGIRAAKTNTEVLEFADIVFLAVKPQYLEAVGVTHVDAYIVTHWHLDHCMNVNHILERWGVAQP